MSPLVSVYITTHNRGERLIRAVQSVLNQTYKNIEIIISDDGSKDNTPEIVASLMLEHENIRSVRSDIPRGANHARNRALDIAKGEFITGLDDDDEFKESRINTFVTEWDEKYSFLCDDFVNIIGGIEVANFNNLDIYEIKVREMLLHNAASNQVFTKTSRLRKVGGFNEKLNRLQDWDCWLRLVEKYGPALRLNKKTYIMYHDESHRVSKNELYRQAHKTLVKENIDLFNTLPRFFSDKYFLEIKPGNIFDILYCRSKIEIKIVLKSFLTKYKFRYLKTEK